MEIFYFPGEYLDANMPEDKLILLNIEGNFADIMCEVNPEHKNNIRVENGVQVIYLRLLKDLYIFIKSALLWYDIYSNTLKSQGFLINLYDRCIANITIQDKQCTMPWYVDNKKVSHIDEEVNTKLIETISEHSGNLTVSRGKKHKFLGMDIDFLSDGKFYLFMKDYIEESIDLFVEDISTKVSSLAKKGVQNLNESSIRL